MDIGHCSFDCRECPNCKVSVFSDLTDNEFETLNYEKTIVQLQKGQVLFLQDTKPHGLYCVKKGKLKVYRKGSEGKDLRLAGAAIACGVAARDRGAGGQQRGLRAQLLVADDGEESLRRLRSNDAALQWPILQLRYPQRAHLRPDGGSHGRSQMARGGRHDRHRDLPSV